MIENGETNLRNGAWLSPFGEIYYCESDEGHAHTAYQIGFIDELFAERAGYVKLLSASFGGGWCEPVRQLTNSQITALDEWHEKYRTPYPRWFCEFLTANPD